MKGIRVGQQQNKLQSKCNPCYRLRKFLLRCKRCRKPAKLDSVYPHDQLLPSELVKPGANPNRARFLLDLWQGKIDPLDRRFQKTRPMLKFLDSQPSE